MKLVSTRILKTDTYTIGELTVDGKYVCDVLEDKVRPLPNECPYTVKYQNCKCKEKVYGKTAVPAGTYEVKLTYSNRFKKVLPEILNVPHFLGIRIHSGNNSSQTEGCLLVGKWDEIKGDWVSNSRVTFNKLMTLLKEAVNKKENITITIKDI